ncbi:MAG: PA14 domain-containing protein [Chloroflexi bacterium OLB14]|nr:MAG: PA14 domain-containing protein [Chloroflexi bacterium OLB14]
MKLYLRIAIVLLIFIVGFGFVYEFKKYYPQPSGETYQLVSNWPQFPEGVSIGQVSGVAVASNGDVFVFHRAERIWEGEELGLDLIQSATIFVLDNETGNLINSWGANFFVMPHGLTIDKDDNIWLTDVGLHQVFKFDRDGNLLMTLGERGISGDDEYHFNMPTDVAIASDGSIYVSDGYGNSRVAKFSADGKYITSWGSYGTETGQFNTPHSIAIDSHGQIYVADRGNARIQIFNENGEYLSEIKSESIGRPWAIRFDNAGNLFLVDGGDQNQFWFERARILKLDSQGNILASFGSYGEETGQFIWPHTIAIGINGELYIGEVATGMRIQKFINAPN